jgi:outer membrane protein
MKKVFCGLIAIIAVGMCSGAAAWAQSDKIGIVDLLRCYTESKEGKRVIEQLKKKKAVLQKKFDAKQNELLKLQEDLKKQSMMLSMDAKAGKEKEYERKRRELRYTYEDLMNEMRKADADAKKRMFKELQKVINDIGQKGKYLFILERRAGGIMYYGKIIDITDEVIKAYDLTKK